MRKITSLMLMLCVSIAMFAQWEGYTLTSISTTPATSLETGYYLMLNNHSSGGGWMYVGGSSNWTATDVRKSKVRSTLQDIDYMANLSGTSTYKITQPATVEDGQGRKYFVFKITNNGDGTCTIQAHNGQYIPSIGSMGNNTNLTTSATAGRLNWHQYIEGYFSFEENNMGIATVGYSGGYQSRMVSYSARTALNGSNPFTSNSSQSFILYRCEMEEPPAKTN